MKKISIVIPTYNERGNVNDLTHRLAIALGQEDWQYELLFVDDHSTDGTLEYLETLKSQFPIRTFLKKGKRGKAFSLLQGFREAKGDVIAMIDADLQYPPEAIPSMVREMANGLDIVIANRIYSKTGFARQVVSKAFSFLFCKVLHGFDYDVQSGLKVFRREIVERINIKPSEWAFDLEFLTRARDAGYSMGEVDIAFEKRRSGKSKINLLKASWEIGLNAFKLKLSSPKIIPFIQ